MLAMLSPSSRLIIPQYLCSTVIVIIVLSSLLLLAILSKQFSLLLLAQLVRSGRTDSIDKSSGEYHDADDADKTEDVN
jgi:hypothetical protein